MPNHFYANEFDGPQQMCPLDAGSPHPTDTVGTPRLSLGAGDFGSGRIVHAPAEGPRPLLRTLEAQRGAGPSRPGSKALLVEFRIDFERFLSLVILASQPLGLVLER